MSWDIERHTARLWLCTSDVPARFSQVAGVLTAHGLNILNAHAFSLADGTVLDRFIVHMQRGPINTQPDFWQNVRDTLLASVSGELDLDSLVTERMQRDSHEPIPPTRRRVTNVHFDNESSSCFTIVDLVTWDRLGLLYSVGKCLSRLDANIEFALISTRLDVAEDVFYVSDETTGEKITSEERLARMRSELQQAAGTTEASQPAE
jgi:[protein-PII] uridylyltransferase